MYTITNRLTGKQEVEIEVSDYAVLDASIDLIRRLTKISKDLHLENDVIVEYDWGYHGSATRTKIRDASERDKQVFNTLEFLNTLIKELKK